MNPPKPALLSPTIVAPDQGRTLCAFGDTIHLKLDSRQTGGSLAVGLGIVEPGFGPPPHLHRNEDELFIIVEGTMSFWTPEDQWRDVGPGGVAFMPRGAPHTFKNRSGSPVKQWILTTPGGFETFFGRCGEVFAAAGADGPDMKRILQIASEHGIEFLPPG